MKILLPLSLLFSALFSVAAEEPFLQWDFARGFKDTCRQQPLEAFDSSGNPSALPSVLKEGKITGVKLDGKTILRTTSRENGSQTIRVMVKFTAPPQGIIISRNRPEDGLRGLECGLANDKGYIFNGPRPAAMISGGDRSTITTLFAPVAPALREGLWYDVFFRFEAGKYMAVDISETAGQLVVYSSRIDCPEIKELSDRAGEKILCFGGRRANSKKSEYLLPEGTLLANPTVWNRALSDTEISAITGAKPAIAAAQYASPQTYYVDAKNGNDKGDGHSPATAFRSIQHAADLVNPGDTVVVQPGLYYEQVNINRGGKPELPIKFIAADGRFGAVTITAADPAIRQGKVKWQPEDASLNLYSIALDHNPARVLYSGTDLLPYPTLDGLKQFMLQNGYPGIEHGFHYAAGERKLYIRLHASGKYGVPDPNQHTMAVAPINAEGFNGTQIWRPTESNIYVGIRTPAHVFIDGFTFETPGAAGVVTCGSNVIIRNCWFKGCRFGVFGSGREENRPENIFIENCHYDQAYAFNDMVDVINKWRQTNIAEKHQFYWWQRKGINNDSRQVKNYETGLPGGVGRNWHIRDNVIEEAFEGMSSWAIDRSENAQIYGNRFRRLVDNAIETENHNRNMRIYFNRVEDVFEPFSWQPLGGLPWPGPVFIYRNIVTISPELNKLWPTHVPGCFKIGASGRNWESPEMGNAPATQLATRISKRFVAVPDPGFMVFNNTILFPYGRLITTPMPTDGRARRELVNFRFFNNIFNVDSFHSKPEWDGSLLEFFANIYVANNPADPRRELVAGENGLSLNKFTEVKLRDASAQDFQLQPDSPALKRGITTMEEVDASADAGAIPSGTSWQLTAGPGAGITEDKQSEFQRAHRYQSQFIRTIGPTPGIWAIYRQEGLSIIDLKVPEQILQNGSINMVFRTTGEKHTEKMLDLNPFLTLTLQEDKTGSQLLWSSKNTPSVKLSAALPPWPNASWQHLSFHWDAKGRITAELNGKTLSLNGGETIAPVSQAIDKLSVIVGRNPIADVTITAP